MWMCPTATAGSLTQSYTVSVNFAAASWHGRDLGADFSHADQGKKIIEYFHLYCVVHTLTVRPMQWQTYIFLDLMFGTSIPTGVFLATLDTCQFNLQQSFFHPKHISAQLSTLEARPIF